MPSSAEPSPQRDPAAGPAVYLPDPSSFSYSSTESSTATGRPCFSIVTGSARAVSISRPHPFLAFPGAITFIVWLPFRLSYFGHNPKLNATVAFVMDVSAQPHQHLRGSWPARRGALPSTSGRLSRGQRFSSSAPWRRSTCCLGDCHSRCSRASARGRAACCMAVGRGAAARPRRGRASGRPHSSR
jgi:hypothetical protein